jgi:hypothetical protein
MRLAAAVLLAVVLAGCGSSTGSSLEDAAEATAADTSRIEMTYHFAALGDEKEVTFGANGVFDFPNERGVMTLSDEFPLFEEGVSLREFRLLGPTGYTRWIVKGKTYWVKDPKPEGSGDPFEQLIPFPGTPTKPTDVLERVLSATDEIKLLGDEDVRGAETAHYRARVGVLKLVEQLPEADRPPGDVIERWGARFVPVDIWIDDESRLRRITIGQPKDPGGSSPAMTVTAELFDYGVEVDVEAPPAEETISREEFDRLTSTSTGWAEEGGEAEAMTPEEICQSPPKELPKDQVDRLCRDLRGNG